MADPTEKPDWRVEAGRKGNAARKSKGNQYTSGRMHPAHVEDMRARIQTGIMLAKLHKDALGKAALSDGQRASIKLLIDKALPTLQAVESTHSEPAMSMSEADIINQITVLLRAYPELVNQAQAELARSSTETVSSAPQPKADVA